MSIERVRAELDLIDRETDAFERRHNAKCECEYAPAVRETVARIREVLDQPQQRHDSSMWRTEVKVLGVMSAVSWLLAILATIDWIGGNPAAPSGTAAFAITGSLFAWASLYLRKTDRDDRKGAS